MSLSQAQEGAAPSVGAAVSVAKGTAIILKLDDLNGFIYEMPRWQKVIDLLKERKIKCSIGIICDSLEKDDPSYLTWIKDVQSTGLVEFWFHGYDHKIWKEEGKDVREFSGPSYEQQKDHFVRSEALAKEKLGLTFAAFGAPFNVTDDTTVKVLSEEKEMKIILYGRPKDAKALPDRIILERTEANLENPTFVPNPDKLKIDYEKLSGTQDVLVLQGHPGKWNEERYAAFVQILDYLISKEVVFVTPSEYYNAKRGISTP